MLPVFICEDNPVLLQQYRQTIENLILIEEYDIELLTAVTTPEAPKIRKQGWEQKETRFAKNGAKETAVSLSGSCTAKQCR